MLVTAFSFLLLPALTLAVPQVRHSCLSRPTLHLTLFHLLVQLGGLLPPDDISVTAWTQIDFQGAGLINVVAPKSCVNVLSCFDGTNGAQIQSFKVNLPLFNGIVECDLHEFVH
jgi:hypothetical protein